LSTRKICIQCGAAFGMEQRFCPNDGAALRPTGSEDHLIGQVIADRYQVLELIGEGGMGRVYLAEHVRMGRKSAVKVMSPNLALAADAISRFNREASNASRINHPNVAQIYDFGETSTGMLYLAMEFVEGETLRTLVERDGPLPLARAAGLTKQIADALGAAHHIGIVHRDLKPDNVMIARHHDGTDWVKVVDFGIAKTMQGSGEGGGSQTVTTAGVALGTPEYMSPEQLAGERLDSRTDQYSLGIVLFNMLTGDLPYPRVTSRETLVRRLTTKPRTLSDAVPEVAWPAPLQAALDRALAPEALDRYAWVADFGRDVASAASPDASRGLQAAPTYVIRPSEPTQRIAVPATPLRPAPARQPVWPGGVHREATRRVNPRSLDRSTRRRALVLSGVLLVLASGAVGAVVAARALRTGRPNQQATAQVERQHDTGAVTSPPAAGARVQSVTSTPVAAAPGARGDSARADGVRADSVRADSVRADSVRADSVRIAEARRAAITGRNVSAAKAAPRADSAKPPLSSNVAARNSAPAAWTGGNAGLHGWIRPNGDSGEVRRLPPDATDDQRVRYLTDEIRGHMVRANHFLVDADVPKLRTEVRNAQSDVAMLRALYPAAADSLHVQQLVRAAAVRLLESCPSVMADTTKHFPPTFTCAQLFPGMGRGRQGGLGRRPKG